MRAASLLGFSALLSAWYESSLHSWNLLAFSLSRSALRSVHVMVCDKNYTIKPGTLLPDNYVKGQLQYVLVKSFNFMLFKKHTTLIKSK
jgi:hypothetical protein